MSVRPHSHLPTGRSTLGAAIRCGAQVVVAGDTEPRSTRTSSPPPHERNESPRGRDREHGTEEPPRDRHAALCPTVGRVSRHPDPHESKPCVSARFVFDGSTPLQKPGRIAVLDAGVHGPASGLDGDRARPGRMTQATSQPAPGAVREDQLAALTVEPFVERHVVVVVERHRADVNPPAALQAPEEIQQAEPEDDERQDAPEYCHATSVYAARQQRRRHSLPWVGRDQTHLLRGPARTHPRHCRSRGSASKAGNARSRTPNGRGPRRR